MSFERDERPYEVRLAAVREARKAQQLQAEQVVDREFNRALIVGLVSSIIGIVGVAMWVYTLLIYLIPPPGLDLSGSSEAQTDIANSFSLSGFGEVIHQSQTNPLHALGYVGMIIGVVGTGYMIVKGKSLQTNPAFQRRQRKLEKFIQACLRAKAIRKIRLSRCKKEKSRNLKKPVSATQGQREGAER